MTEYGDNVDDRGAPAYFCSQCGAVVREGRECEDCLDEGGEG